MLNNFLTIWLGLTILLTGAWVHTQLYAGKPIHIAIVLLISLQLGFVFVCSHFTWRRWFKEEYRRYPSRVTTALLILLQTISIYLFAILISRI